MLRPSIAILLIVSFLPIPGRSLTFGPGSLVSGDRSVMQPVSVICESVVRQETDTDGEMPHDEVIIFESESEISEGEFSENAESESIDFAGVFDRQEFSDCRCRFFIYLTSRGSDRFSNPNEVFRILRC